MSRTLFCARLAGFRAKTSRALGAAVILSLVFTCHNAFAAAWAVEREWTDKEERAFSQWFETLASRQWKSTNQMLHSARYNSLYDATDDALYFYADCGDLPYIVRAYYAYKRRLPFVANYVSGGRYSLHGNSTASTYDNLGHEGTTQGFFGKLTGVHTGNFRTPPKATDSFTYPIAIDRGSLRPGMVFYSPNGHVAMVAECAEDGSIKLLDAHPDQSVTRINFSPKLEVRSRTYSGGFRAFRKTVVRNGRAAWVADNDALPNYSLEQYQFADYYSTIRNRLMRIRIDPLAAFEKYIRDDTYSEVLDRIAAVERGWSAARVQHVSLPSNIYDAVGDWEDFSTPGRDLRLRHSFLNIPTQIRGLMRLMVDEPSRVETSMASPAELGRELLRLKERLFNELTVQYVNSAGDKVTLSLADIEARLFRLSFDPNHAPELRWGASGDELSTALRIPHRHRADYEQQQYWRNRLEKKQGPMTPGDGDNPRRPPRHDLTAMIAEVIENAPVILAKLAGSGN